jgi:hypothetical protein
MLPLVPLTTLRAIIDAMPRASEEWITQSGESQQLELPPWRGRPAVATATDVDSKRFLEPFVSVMTRK